MSVETDEPNKFLLGWEEWIAMPDLGLPAIKAKVDTGARTSALHAVRIEPFGSEAKPQVRFIMHPDPEDHSIEVVCSARVKDKRLVTSSNGQSELRYVIQTKAKIGGKIIPIEISLTNRETMGYRMLLGRSAIQDDVSVRPTESFLQSELSYSVYKKRRKSAVQQRPLRIGILTQSPDNYSNKRMIEAALEKADYPSALSSLADLREPIDVFFEAVVVNSDNVEERARRLSLLSAIVGTFHQIADFSRLDG